MMNGHHTGALTVFARENNGNDVRMWRMNGDRSANWQRASVDVNMNNVREVIYVLICKTVYYADYYI